MIARANKPTPKTPLKTYLQKNFDAVRQNPPPAWPSYAGLESWRYVLRQIAVGLADYPDRDIQAEQGAIYGSLIVAPCIRCGQQVPLSNKQALDYLWEIIRFTRGEDG